MNKTTKKQWVTLLLLMSKRMFHTCLLVCTLSGTLLAFKGNSQSLNETKVNVEATNARLVDILLQIEKQTDFRFSYTDDVRQIDNVNVRAKAMRLDLLLEELSSKAKVSFRQWNEMIAVAKSKVSMTLTDPIKVSGKVVDAETSDPIPGVNVLVKGTTQGVVTPASGEYSLMIDQLPATLLFSFIGYTSQEVEVGAQSVINIAMAPDTKTLQEVVVIGYGEQSRAKVTSAISQVKEDQLSRYSASSFALQLTGRAAGVVINDASAQPGADPQIVIRGLGTLTAGRNPLIVVDGFPLSEGTPFNSINPQDIESVEILKDPSSAAIYGSRAANGVILVSTKKGKSESLKIAFDAYTGFQDRADKVEYANAEETALFLTEARDWGYVSKNPANRSSNDDRATRLAKGASLRELRLNYLQPYLDKQPGLTDTNWLDEIYRKGKISSYNLSLSGGAEKTNYYVSTNYFDQEGLVRNNELKRLSGTIKIDSKISDQLHFGISVNPSYSKQDYIDNTSDFSTDPISGLFIMYPFFAPYRADGSLSISDQIVANTPEDGALGENIVALVTKIKNQRTYFRNFGNTSLSFEPLKGLTFKTMLGSDIVSNFFDFYNPSDVGQYRGTAPKPAIAKETRDFNINYLIENTVNFSRTFNDHNLSVLGGYTFQKETGRNTVVTGSGISDDKIPNIGGASAFTATADRYTWTQVSYLARLQYDYKDRYLFSATVRRDGSSRFGNDSKWATFPSVTAGWILSNESFFPQTNILTFAKLRASWGTSGNNQISNYGSKALVNSANYVFGNTLGAGFAASTTANPNLSWETKTSVNAGLNVGLFNKFNIGVDYYRSISNDLLLNVPIPEQSGFNSSLQNIGEIKNTGLEIELSSSPINLGPVKWEFSANGATNQNEVMKLAPGQDQILTGSESTFLTRIGGPIAELYGYKVTGVYKSQEEINNTPHLAGTLVGDYKVEDLTGDGIIDLADRKGFGSYNPKFTYGFDSRFEYKGFDLSFSFNGIVGRTLYDRGFALQSESGEGFGVPTKYYFDNRYHPIDNPNGTLGQPNLGNFSNARKSTRGSSLFFSDADYLRLRNIQIGYNVPKGVLDRLRLSRARLYVTGNNLLTITNFHGFNPDATSTGNLLTNGLAYGNYPIAKSYIVGINITL